jgi:hypothetical protein
VESSRTRLCSIVDGEMPLEFNYCKPLLIFKDGNRLSIEQNFRNLIWYDITKKNDNMSEKILKKSCLFQTATCMGSLILLHGFIVVGRISWSVVAEASLCVLMTTVRSTGP